jgi:hypothetical protein
VSSILPHDFDQLLRWLHPERDNASRIYEGIRYKLTHFFRCRGCTEPDVLADSTIDRVNVLIVRDDFTFTGKPILFFYGVARNIWHEWQRKENRPKPKAADLYATPENPLRYDCLESCMKELVAEQRNLIVSYYEYESGQKAETRVQLARRCGMAENALRLRVHRIRRMLRVCINKCMQDGNSTTSFFAH